MKCLLRVMWPTALFFMDGGYIVEEGKPDDVINHPQKERTKAFLERFTSLHTMASGSDDV